MFGQKCPVCNHAHCDEIDAEIKSGKSVNGTAKKWGFHRNSLVRHLERHVGYCAAKKNQEWTPPETYLAIPQDLREPTINKVERLADRMEKIADLAQERGNADLAIKASRELRANFELTAKLTGETRAAEVAVAGPQTIQVSIQSFAAPGKNELPPSPQVIEIPMVDDAEEPLLLPPGDDAGLSN